MAIPRIIFSPLVRRLALYGLLGVFVLLAINAPSPADDIVVPQTPPSLALTPRPKLSNPDVPVLVATGNGMRNQHWSGQLFKAALPAPNPKPSSAPVVLVTEPALVVPPPSMPWRLIGSMNRQGERVVFFNRQQETIVVRAGEELPGGYRLDEVSAEGVTVTYLPSGTSQQLLLSKAGQ